MPEPSSQNPSIENEFIRFTLSPRHNTWQLKDKRAGVSWGNTPETAGWVSVRQSTPEGPKKLILAMHSAALEEDAIHAHMLEPVNNWTVNLVFRLNADALQVYLLPAEGTGYTSIDLFERGLEANSAELGEAVAPIRMGLLLPADSHKPFDLHLGTYEYEGVHMAMAGLFKSGAALLASWGDPYLTLNLARLVPADSATPPRLNMSFSLTKTARSLQLRCLGHGDLAALAAAYRQQADSLGYRVTWSEKLKSRPQAARLFGACNFKLWTALARNIDAAGVEKSVEVHWTFDEVAQIAEHLHRDLELKDVLFHLGGWSTYGYDCRHPDIMPANPECGGDAGLADCARRVQACGYLFCLHDNYQDMYRDAPSWDEACIEKLPDGSLFKGGVWLGGQAYYTCSREALKLAQRPQNLERVRDVVHPDLYFIDTTYAVGPQECYDPRHPLTRQEDIFWKAALSDYARQVIGMFGSECGREWAVPHADFFEGLASVSGQYYHMLKPEELDGRVVPLFDMVFRDSIAIYGKYGYQPEEMAEQVIHHAAIGRPLYYHSLDKHLYWQKPGVSDELALTDTPYDAAIFTRAHNGWAEGFCLWDRFMKNTQEILGPLNKLTAQALTERYDFLDEGRLVRKTTFSNGVMVWVNGSADNFTVDSETGGKVILPPYGLLVEAGSFIAFLALSWQGQRYTAPVLFTLTSLDGQPLSSAPRVRVFHGFGDAQLAWRGQMVTVPREAVITA